MPAAVWKKYEPKKPKQLDILVCERCNNHHWHILNLGGTRYAQCGKCKNMVML